MKEEREPDKYQQFISKLRVYDIADQDSLFTWITSRHPELFYILNRAPLSRDKREAVFRGMYLDGNEEITSLDWLNEHVIQNHGPLGALYPQKTWTAPNPHGAMKEGDTPSWFYFYENGLQVPAHPEYGGWGGRFALTEGRVYNDHTETWENITNERVTVARWREEFQRDFAARMDWSVRSPENSNHAPVAVVNKDASAKPLFLIAAPGDTLTLDASQSSDRDGDRLRFEWMIYPTGPDDLLIGGQTEGVATMILPDLTDNSLHLVLKVIDDGTPALTGYKRIIIRHH